MRMHLNELRKIIREEVDRNMRWTAGIFGGASTANGIQDADELYNLDDDDLKDIDRIEDEQEEKLTLPTTRQRT